MKIIADTHIVIWDALVPEKLSNKARREFDIANDSEGIIISDISLWEISMLMDRKRLIIDTSYLEFIELLRWSKQIIFQPIVPEIAKISTEILINVNSDPADRIISATSLYMDVPLITADKNILRSKQVNTIW